MSFGTHEHRGDALAGTDSQCERGLVQASERHDDWNDGSCWPDLHIRGECWSRRSSHGSAGLACGHEQLERVESADAAQR